MATHPNVEVLPTEIPIIFVPPSVESTPLPSIVPRVINSCLQGVEAKAECLTELKPSYTYTSLFGGRGDEGLTLSATAGTLNMLIPKGYYENKTVTIKDTDLVATNILAGVTIFGVTGDLDNSANANCTVGNLLDSSLPNPSTCNLTSSAGNYAYQAKYGGRINKCSITESTTTGSSLYGLCWLDSTQGTYYIYDKQVYYPECVKNSRITLEWLCSK